MALHSFISRYICSLLDIEDLVYNIMTNCIYFFDIARVSIALPVISEVYPTVSLHVPFHTCLTIQFKCHGMTFELNRILIAYTRYE